MYSGGKSLFIEIFVTHRIDDNKLDKLRETKISTIEIDLSKKTEIITTEELTDILLNDSEEKQWKYNNFSAESFQKFMSVADRKSIVPRGFALHVDNCPIKSRKWNGRPYANVMKDCLYCEYCVSYTEYVYCTGRARIATINDFRIPEGERIRTSDLKYKNEKEEMFANQRCPNCGNTLVERNGKNGFFLGCSNYPHCRFTASVNPKTGEINLKL